MNDEYQEQKIRNFIDTLYKDFFSDKKADVPAFMLILISTLSDIYKYRGSRDVIEFLFQTFIEEGELLHKLESERSKN